MLFSDYLKIKKRILFAGFLKSHDSDIGPLIFHLKKISNWKIFFFKGLHPEEDVFSRCEKISNPISSRLNRLKFKLNTEERLLCSRLLASLCDKEETGYLMKIYRQIKKIALNKIKTIKPDLIILPEDTDPIRGRLWAMIALNYKIKVCVIWPAWYNIFKTYPHMRRKLAKNWLVFGRSSKDFLISKGVKPCQIHLVGSVRFDNLCNKKKFLARKDIKKKYGLELPEKYIIFVAQAREDTEYYIKEAIKAMEGFPKLGLLIKIHPHDKIKKYFWVKSIANKSKKISIDKKAPLLDCMIHAKGIITVSSIAAYEALLFKKEVVLLRFKHTIDDFDLINKKAPVYSARNSDELIKYINIVASNKNLKGIEARNIFLNKILGPLDGASRLRIVKKLVSFLSQPKI